MKNKRKNRKNRTIDTWQNRFKNKVAKALDLPKDLMFDLPRTTLIGDMQLYVENHLGLLEFSHNKIRLHTKTGELYIYGEELVIRGVMYREILIEGNIDQIKWKRQD
ncbi:sporulation protein YqfC [Desulfuribacillus alkaliarsenatis]|uniref:Sporulation protein YqfC n=1 Tax=Desulfuribacillus alkaliarsenatis TaxID=766136 RepID=A0A1E5G058_9FIRM|nr:sporulation protein YqfC [Desulfuribacillus alkaliarsenatis]OEF96225.1 sporulation protein YqfC [Desulfuribacillus alkaliarsenatis]